MVAPVRYGGFASYAEYLESPHWQALRWSFCCQGATCYGCDRARPLQLHHMTYDTIGRETAADLVPLCSFCHKRVHRQLKKRFFDLPLHEQVKHTVDVFVELFSRTLADACTKHHHDRRWQNHLNPPKPIVLTNKNRPKNRRQKKKKKSKTKQRSQRIDYSKLPVTWKGSALIDSLPTKRQLKKMKKGWKPTPVKFEVRHALAKDVTSARLKPSAGTALADLIRKRNQGEATDRGT